MIKKAYSGNASGSIFRMAIGISLLVILLPGLANAQGTSPPNYITQWGSLGNGDGQFKYPNSVAVDSSGNIYVADTDNDRIQKFSSTGTFITKWGSRGSGDGQFIAPYGLTVDSSGNVYVSDENHRIQKFTTTGTFITKWGSVPWGTGDGEFKTPIGIAVDSSGNVYVADMENHRIQKFSSTGTFITKWGSDGSGDGQFSYPIGIAIDTSGNVYVSDDSENNHIQKFSSTGTFITKWGSQGSGDGQFDFSVYSNDIAVDSSGSIYVADTGNNRIQKFGNLAAPTNPTLIVDKVWTMDGNNKDKTKFVPGDAIRFGIAVKNDGSSTVKGVFSLQVTGSKNIVQIGETPKDFAPGLTTFGISYDPGIIPKDAPAGTYTIAVTVSYNGQDSSKQSQFTVQAPPTPPIPEPPPTPSKIGEISGTVFDDFKGDGVKNPDGAQGEPGLADWTIKLISGGKTIDTKVTKEFGNYIFKNVPAGNYEVREIKKNGWDTTKPIRGSYKLKISDGQKITEDFGNLLNVKNQKKKKLPNTFYSGIFWDSGAIDVSQQAFALDASLRESYADTSWGHIDYMITSLGGMYDVYAAYKGIATKRNYIANPEGNGNYKIAFGHSGGTQTLMDKLERGGVKAEYAVFIAPALINKARIDNLIKSKKVKKVIIVESDQDLLYNMEAEFKPDQEFVIPGDADVPQIIYHAPAVIFRNFPPDLGGLLNGVKIVKDTPMDISNFINDNHIERNWLPKKPERFWAGGADRKKQTLFKDVFKESDPNVKVIEMYEKKDGNLDSNSVHHLLLVKTIEAFLNRVKPFDGSVDSGLRDTRYPSSYT